MASASSSSGAAAPPAPPAAPALSRLVARLALELAVEARFPRIIAKKPVFQAVMIGAESAAPRARAGAPADGVPRGAHADFPA